jgi:hypothetical protein
MSLNAVPFYERAGFHASGGVEALGSASVVVPIVRMEKRVGGQNDIAITDRALGKLHPR